MYHHCIKLTGNMEDLSPLNSMQLLCHLLGLSVVETITVYVESGQEICENRLKSPESGRKDTYGVSPSSRSGVDIWMRVSSKGLVFVKENHIPLLYDSIIPKYALLEFRLLT